MAAGSERPFAGFFVEPMTIMRLRRRRLSTGIPRSYARTQRLRQLRNESAGLAKW